MVYSETYPSLHVYASLRHIKPPFVANGAPERAEGLPILLSGLPHLPMSSMACYWVCEAKPLLLLSSSLPGLCPFAVTSTGNPHPGLQHETRARTTPGRMLCPSGSM